MESRWKTTSFRFSRVLARPMACGRRRIPERAFLFLASRLSSEPVGPPPDRRHSRPCRPSFCRDTLYSCDFSFETVRSIVFTRTATSSSCELVPHDICQFVRFRLSGKIFEPSSFTSRNRYDHVFDLGGEGENCCRRFLFRNSVRKIPKRAPVFFFFLASRLSSEPAARVRKLSFSRTPSLSTLLCFCFCFFETFRSILFTRLIIR